MDVVFTGDTTRREDILYFTCIVQYSTELDYFLPSELTRPIDREGSAITPFSGGKGGFEAASLALAEETEAEIRALLQSAYRDFHKTQRGIDLWTGARDFALREEEETVQSLPDH